MTHALMDVAMPSDGETSFDYGDIAKEDKEDLEKQAGRIRDLKDQVQRFAVATVLDMGRTLAEARTRFSHRGNGTFIKWCKERCGLQKNAAYRSIRVYRAFGECTTVGQTVDISALCVLSEQACPNEARAEALRLAQDDHYVSKHRALDIRSRHEQEAKDQCDATSPSPEELADRNRSDMARLFRKWQRQGASLEFIRERIAASIERGSRRKAIALLSRACMDHDTICRRTCGRRTYKQRTSTPPGAPAAESSCC